MTGKELIIYILQNNLEDEQVFKDGKFIGFLTIEEAAIKMNVGISTIVTLLDQGKLNGIKIGKFLHFVCDDENLRKENNGNA